MPRSRNARRHDGELPYDTIDMDFMNENQSAHGDREYGHIVSRMGIERKIIAGHWTNKSVQKQIGSWMRTVLGVIESPHIRVFLQGEVDVLVEEYYSKYRIIDEGREPDEFRRHVAVQAQQEIVY